MNSSHLPGILAMLAGSFCFSVNDALVKRVVLGQPEATSIFMVVFLRGLLMSALLATVLATQDRLRLHTLLKPSLLHGRGVIEAGMTIFFFSGVLLLPLTDVYTILLTAPLLITTSGALLFKEQVSWRGWAAVLLGFAGVMVVVWPDNLGWQTEYALPILATFLLVYREIYTKRIPRHYSGMEVVLITGLIITVAAGLASLPYWVNLGWDAILPIVGASLMLAIAHVMSVLSIRLAPLSVTSPGRYSMVLFGAVSAFLILGEIPSINTVVGSAVVVASGLLLLNRKPLTS
ncbi:MAG: DMT family transporter [SAR324 cluster bacterium]|nr:DMT family transporter [SAR324 cluster bacterium]